MAETTNITTPASLPVPKETHTLSYFSSHTTLDSTIHLEDRPDLVKCELDIAHLKSQLGKTAFHGTGRADLIYQIAAKQKQLHVLEADQKEQEDSLTTVVFGRRHVIKVTIITTVSLAIIAGIVTIVVLVSQSHQDYMMSGGSPLATTATPSTSSAIPGGIMS